MRPHLALDEQVVRGLEPAHGPQRRRAEVPVGTHAQEALQVCDLGPGRAHVSMRRGWARERDVAPAAWAGAAKPVAFAPTAVAATARGTLMRVTVRRWWAAARRRCARSCEQRHRSTGRGRAKVERSSSSPRRDSPRRRTDPAVNGMWGSRKANCSNPAPAAPARGYPWLKPVRRMAPQPCLRRTMSYTPARR